MLPFGQPGVVQAAGDAERVLAIAPDGTGRRVAVLSTNTLRVWGGERHTLLLGHCSVPAFVPVDAAQTARATAATSRLEHLGAHGLHNSGAQFELSPRATLVWGPPGAKMPKRGESGEPDPAHESHARIVVWQGVGVGMVFDITTLATSAAPAVVAPTWVQVEGGPGEDAANTASHRGGASATTADGTGGSAAWCRARITLASKWGWSSAWGGSTQATEASGQPSSRLSALFAYGGSLMLFNSAGMVRVVSGDWAAPQNRGELLVSSLLQASSPSVSPSPTAVEAGSGAGAGTGAGADPTAGAQPEQSREPVPALQLRTHAGAERMTVVRAAVSPLLRLAALVLSDGRVVVISLNTDVYEMRRLGCSVAIGGDANGAETPRGGGASILPAHGTSVAVSASSACVAVGTADAVVEMWSVSRHLDGSLSAALTRRVSLRQWDFRAHDVGPVSCLAWSPCGDAVAAGYSRRGLAVWARSGCRTWSTLPSAGASVAARLRPGEPLATGTRALAWGSGGWVLFAAPEEGSYPPAAAGDGHAPVPPDATALAVSPASRLVVFPMARSCAIAGSSLRGVGGMHGGWSGLMLRPDAAFVLDNRHVRVGELSWAPLRVSPVYVSANQPLNVAAMSDDGQHVAVAGRRGLALVAVRSGKWRVFGDVLQEMEVRCHLVAWLGSRLVAMVHCAAPDVSSNGLPSDDDSQFGEKRSAYVGRALG